MESSKLSLDLSFEQAYAHYRLNSLHKSLAVLDAVKNPQVPRSTKIPKKDKETKIQSI